MEEEMRERLERRARERGAQQATCNHAFELLDAGPYSDDICYIVCKKCDYQKL